VGSSLRTSSSSAAVSIPSMIDTAAELEEVRRLESTVIPAVPRVLRSFGRQYGLLADKRTLFGPSARFVCSAGGKPDYDRLEHLHNQGVDVIEFYGSTEASLVACTLAGEWR